MNLPETRNSIIARLGNPDDADAWNQFSEVYRPIIVRIALSKGLQPADAEDLAQTILVSVASAIDRWDPNGPARFRTWLKRVTDNAILNSLSRQKPDRAAGSDAVAKLLCDVSSSDTPDSDLLNLEYQREVFQWAAENIRSEFSDLTWQAFWLTAVDSISAEQVGQRLGKKRGSIYAARSRVMRRLLVEVERFEKGVDENEG